MLPPLRDLLDPRENPDPPFADSVWIPLSELPTRLGELGPREAHLRIASCEEAEPALGFLTNGKRQVSVVNAPYGPCPPGRLWSPNPWLEKVWPSEAKSAVDLGCGAGRELAYLAARGIRVQGVERLSEACESARRLVNRYTGHDVDVENSDFDVWVPKESVDVAVALMAVPLRLFDLPVKWIVFEAYAHDAAKPADARRRAPAKTPDGWREVVSEREGDRFRALYERL